MRHRLFIAYPVSQEAGRELERIQSQLKGQNHSIHVTWSRSNGFHITLAFLGEVEDNDVEIVRLVINKAIQNANPFYYWLDRMDAFPNTNHPKILIVEIKEEHRDGAKLQKAVFAGLVEKNLLEDDKPWRSHVTLGRNKAGERIIGLNIVDVNKISWLVDKVELIESKLTSGGPEYVVLGTFKLI